MCAGTCAPAVQRHVAQLVCWHSTHACAHGQGVHAERMREREQEAAAINQPCPMLPCCRCCARVCAWGSTQRQVRENGRDMPSPKNAPVLTWTTQTPTFTLVEENPVFTSGKNKKTFYTIPFKLVYP